MVKNLEGEVQEILKNKKLKVLIIFDFDGTLLDTFNSVLKPLFNSLKLDLGTYNEFSNRKGSFNKYLNFKGHFLNNLNHFSQIKQFHFKDLLHHYYLEFGEEIKEMKKLTNSLSKLPNIEFGIVSRNYVEEYFNPEEMIKKITLSKNFFNKKDFFVKRVNPIHKKTAYFKHIKEEYKNHYIISIGDQIDDFKSAIKAGINYPISIQGYDSSQLFKLSNIETINPNNLLNLIYKIIIEADHKNTIFKNSIDF